ncbi:hypothetical protein WAA20_03405 [Butyrivibrio fibrisolvens]
MYKQFQHKSQPEQKPLHFKIIIFPEQNQSYEMTRTSVNYEYSRFSISSFDGITFKAPFLVVTIDAAALANISISFRLSSSRLSSPCSST